MDSQSKSFQKLKATFKVKRAISCFFNGIYRYLSLSTTFSFSEGNQQNSVTSFIRLSTGINDFIRVSLEVYL